jgi:hypothetical protein
MDGRGQSACRDYPHAVRERRCWVLWIAVVNLKLDHYRVRFKETLCPKKFYGSGKPTCRF